MKPLVEPPLPQRGPGCPPALVLESVAASETKAPDLGPHLESCRPCRGYVDQLREEGGQFVKQRPADLFLRQLESRSRPRLRAWLRPALAFAVPALAAAVFLPVLFREPDPSPMRLKGGKFTVVVKRPGAAVPERVTEDMALRAGDALRFLYAAPRDGYLLILNLDGTGRVTVFYPSGGARSAPIRGGEADPLPGSVVLDASPGPEWLVAVFSDRPLEVAPLADQLRAHAPGLPIELRCGDCQVEAIRAKKK